MSILRSDFRIHERAEEILRSFKEPISQICVMQKYNIAKE